MDQLSLFIIEVAISCIISFSLIYLIKPLLREILIESCGTTTRADFWVMFSLLMLVIAPLLLVIYFAPTQAGDAVNSILEIQDSLFRSLLGSGITLLVIAYVIWQAIKVDMQAATTMAVVSKAASELEPIK